MNHDLAIFAPQVGVQSETFIERHMRDLFPGRTVVVANTVDGASAGHWSADCPMLVVNRIDRGRLRQRVVQAVAEKLGLQSRNRLEIAKRFLQKHHVQVVMGEYLDMSLPWLQVAKKMGIRFFAHAHGYDVSRRLRDPKWRSAYLRYNESDGVIAVSEASRARLLGLGLMPSKVHVVPCGVNVPAEPLMRIEQPVVRCVAVGRMVAKKAPILTLDAFRRAAEVCPNLHLDFVGAGELLPAALQFVRAFNLEDRVTLHGGQPNHVVDRLMKKSDIFLQHSVTDPITGDEEGLPVAILEAMANSLPVVSTRHAGILETVLEGATGYLVDEGDSLGMMERLLTLARDPELRRHLGEAGWRRAREHFSWGKERADLLRILGLELHDSQQ